VKEIIGVVGAGMMGAEIAFIYARAGHTVLVTDSSPDNLKAAAARLKAMVDKGIDRGLIVEPNATSSLERIQFLNDVEAFAAADFVTEAVFESVDVKSRVIAALSEICKPDCVLATNTSTIPISTLAAGLSAERRKRFVGTHYFSPVSRMKLVEVIPGFETAESTVRFVSSLCSSAGKTPIRIKDVPGFAVNRMLHAFIIEAVRLVEEGVATPADIDTACRLGLGHPIGPFALLDAVTSSLSVQAQEIMHEAYGERFRPPALLKQRVRAGYVGGKGRPGWLTNE